MKAILAVLLLAAVPVLAQEDAQSVVDGMRTAARKQQAIVQKPADVLVFDGSKYNFARAAYNRGGDVGAIHSAREYLFRSDAAAVGGPRHVASFIYEPCALNPGVCLVLLEPIRDLLKAQGDDANPYVYAVASSVLSVAAGKFRTISGLNPAYNQFTANNRDAAAPAALDILRIMLASSRRVKADDPADVHHSLIYGRETTVAAIGAGLAGAFEDAAPWLEKNLKASLEASKDDEQTVALSAALTARARNADTLKRLGLAYGRVDPAPATAARVALLGDIATVSRTVWPRRVDAAGHGVWDAASVEAARPYFSMACAVTYDEKNGCLPPATPSALCQAATTLFASVPKNHRATCSRAEGTPSEL